MAVQPQVELPVYKPDSNGYPQGMAPEKEQALASPAVEDVPTSELCFDYKNPRFFLEHDESEEKLILRLWRDFAVDEVALSIAHNGYFHHEPLFATTEDERLVVIEGNRRLAAVRLLTDDELRQQVKATDLPDISQKRRKELQKLPVIKCQRNEVWQYIGFKHVNGPQPWRSYAKAKYVAWVHNELKVPLEDIADMIGDRHTTVSRHYRSLMVLSQAANSGVYDIEDRWKNHFAFSHLFTGLGYKNVQKFLGIDNATSFQPNPIPEDSLKNLGYFLRWLYGQKSTNTRPLIQSQNPDLRRLEDTLGYETGLIALKRGLPLDVAEEISTGDEELFRANLMDARRHLQYARGKQLTGDRGDIDTLQIAREIFDLADRLVLDMEAHRRKERVGRRKSHTKV